MKSLKVKNKKTQNRWVREGMSVKVVAGNDKGQTGTVLRRTSERVVVQGINVRKKHVKKSQTNPNGGILDVELAIHISNVRPCDENGAVLRLRTRTNDSGERELVHGKAGAEVLYRSVKKSK